MNKIPHLFLIIFLTVFETGCSALRFDEYYNQARPTAWRVLSNEEFEEISTYAYVIDFDSISLRVRPSDAGSWDLFGPPLVPFIPVPPDSWLSDSLNFFFYIEVSTSAESLKVLFPSISIRMDSASNAVLPINSFVVYQQFNRIRDEGRYHWKPTFNYMYKFRIKKHPRLLFEVVFREPYLGHTIPSITYIRKSEVHYSPLIFSR